VNVGDIPTAKTAAAAVGTRARCNVGIKINSHRGVVPTYLHNNNNNNINIVIMVCLLFMFMSFTAEPPCTWKVGNIGSKSHHLVPPRLARSCLSILYYYIILPLSEQY